MPLSRSTLQHAVGIALAGALAFGAMILANSIEQPADRGTSQGSGSAGSGGESGSGGAVEGDAERLVGKWQSATAANQAAFVEFSALGVWVGTDGCNATSGTWRFDATGRFVPSGGESNAVGCDNVPLPEAVATAAAVTFRGGDLVLTSHAGEETVLKRASSEGFELTGEWRQQGDAAAAVTFAPNGTWHSVTACETLTGTWRVGDARESEFTRLDPETGALGEAFLTIAVLSLGEGTVGPGTGQCNAEQSLALQHGKNYSFFPSLDGRSFRAAEVARPGGDTRSMEFRR